MTSLRFALAALFLLAACAPVPAQSASRQSAGPVVVTAPPDLGGTRAVLDAQIAATAEASRLAQVGTAEARAVASAQAQSTVEARAWGMTAQALQALSDGATATEWARGTATKAAQPAAFATETRIRNRTALEAERARVALELEKWKQRAALLTYVVAVLVAGYFLASLAPAAADRLRGAEVITAYQISEPQDKVKGYLPAPSTSPSNMVRVADNAHELIEFRARDGRVMLGFRELQTLALALHRGVSFAYRNFGGSAVPNIREVQREFEKQGLAAWKNPGAHEQGMVLTQKGREFLFNKVLGLDDPTPPLEDDPGREGLAVFTHEIA